MRCSNCGKLIDFLKAKLWNDLGIDYILCRKCCKQKIKEKLEQEFYSKLRQAGVQIA